MIFKYCTATIDKVLDPRHRTASGDGIFDWTEHALPYDSGDLLVRTRAISARVNRNFDAWPSAELKKAYRSFIGKPVFVNHENYDPDRTRGKVVDSRYIESGDDRFVELVIAVDQRRFPKLAQEIRSGNLDSVSMGASVDYTVCSIPWCRREARDASEFCDCISYHKGSSLEDEFGQKHLAYETCYGVGFFEISFVFDPADETALIQEVVSTKQEAKTAKTATKAAKPMKTAKYQWYRIAKPTEDHGPLEWALKDSSTDQFIAWMTKEQSMPHDRVGSVVEWGVFGSHIGGFEPTLPEAMVQVEDSLGITTSDNFIHLQAVSQFDVLAGTEEIMRSPGQVDSLREESICPECSDESFDGVRCSFCGYVEYMEGYGSPDTDAVRKERLKTKKEQEEDEEEIAEGRDATDDGDLRDSLEDALERKARKYYLARNRRLQRQ